MFNNRPFCVFPTEASKKMAAIQLSQLPPFIVLNSRCMNDAYWCRCDTLHQIKMKSKGLKHFFNSSNPFFALIKHRCTESQQSKLVASFIIVWQQTPRTSNVLWANIRPPLLSQTCKLSPVPSERTWLWYFGWKVKEERFRIFKCWSGKWEKVDV